MTVEVTDDGSDGVRHADGRRQASEGKRAVLNKVLASHQYSSLS